jgi:hypothetical protein
MFLQWQNIEEAHQLAMPITNDIVHGTEELF